MEPDIARADPPIWSTAGLSQGVYAAVRIWLFCCSSGGQAASSPGAPGRRLKSPPNPAGVSAALDFHLLPTVSRVGM
jgi:hypothetical protein